MQEGPLNLSFAKKAFGELEVRPWLICEELRYELVLAKVIDCCCQNIVVETHAAPCVETTPTVTKNYYYRN